MRLSFFLLLFLQLIIDRRWHTVLLCKLACNKSIDADFKRDQRRDAGGSTGQQYRARYQIGGLDA